MDPSGKRDQMCDIYSRINKHISNFVYWGLLVKNGERELRWKWEPCHLVVIWGIVS
jgi:membrane-anchored protein YejM (alkaline phosphatase superfamily)